jgi:hypothetical protein
MRAALIVAAGWMLCGAAVQGAERGFDDIVRAISEQLHTRPLHIPFFGLVNLATSVAHPAGVKHIDLAVFENLDLDEHATLRVAEAIRSADQRWKPFIRVRSRNHGHEETVMVYMADVSSDTRRDCNLLVITLGPEEATVVELKLNPEGLDVWLNGDRSLHGLRPVSKTSCDECVDR